ncbi:MAG TPA: hypothetical protein ENH84_01070 [Phycisphaerae bacterium]|nr:hypothetical protein [Phycisphaerae bacterium]
MKQIPPRLIVLVGWFLVGCAPPEPASVQPSPPDTTTATASAVDLRVTIHLPKTTFTPGDEFRIKITATNRTPRGVRIKSGSGAPYYIHLLQHKDAGWKQIKTYPSSSMMEMVEWVIPPHETRTFDPVLIVEPDWPTYENLRLKVNLNGRADVAPFLNIEVIKTKPQ